MINETALTVAGDVVTIRLTTRSGHETVLIDEQDFLTAGKLTKLVLYKDPKGRKFARSDKSDGQVLLHRYLFETPKGWKLDWINGDTLDLRRANLQLVNKDGEVRPLAEPQEQVQPQEPNEVSKPKEEATAGGSLEAQPVGGLAEELTEEIKGISFHKASRKWTSRPFSGDGTNKRYSLGYFETKEEAVAQTLIFRAEGPESPKLKRNQRKGNN